MLHRVWVIGGTSGIGRAVAERLVDDNEVGTVIVTGEACDVRDPEALNGYVTSYGGFDGIVYSAGITELDWLENVDDFTMLDIYDVNVLGLIRAVRAGFGDDKPTLELPLKRVVAIGSDAAWRPMRTSAAYCASKAAMHAVVKIIARERAAEDFAINAVAPGITRPTGMSDLVDKEVERTRGWGLDEFHSIERSEIPIGRPATPNEVAEVVCSTLLTSTPYLNGAIIPVNGGR